MFQEGQYAQAIKAYDEFLESHSADNTILYNRGRAYEELKKYKEAEADFNAVLAKDERNLNARLSLSKVYYSQELYNKALLVANEAMELYENSADAHFLSARAKHQLGYVDGAMESYSLALKIDRDYGEAYLYRGALKIFKKQNRSACEDFLKAENLQVREAISIRKKYCK